MPSNKNSDLQKKAIKGIAWSAIANWGSQFAQFLTVLILARLLVPEDFGLISLANIFIHFVQALIGAGFSDAIIQRNDLEEEHLDTAFWINLAIGTTLTIVGILSSSFIARLFSQPKLTPIVISLSFNVLINALGAIHEAILRRNLAFKQLAFRRLGGIIIGSAIGIILAFKGWGVWSLVCQILVGNICDVSLLWLSSKWIPRLKISLQHFQDLFNYGISVVGNGILVFFSNRSDDFIIGYILGAEILGYYTIAFKLLVVVTQLFGQTIQKVILPTFSRLQSETSSLRQAFYSSTSLLNFFSFPVFIAMSLLAPQLVLLLFGEQWVPSILPMQILCLVGIIDSAAYFGGPVFMAKGKPDVLFRLMFFHTVLTISAFLVVASRGIVAISIARVATTFILFIIGLFLLRRLINLNLRMFFRSLAGPLIGSILMGVAITTTSHFLKQDMDDLEILVISSIIGASVYLVSMFLLEPKLVKKLYGLTKLALPTRASN